MMIGSLTFTKKANSRLSCRITVTPELDGLVLRLPNPDL
jgi:2Fe-2S ferredoxin